MRSLVLLFVSRLLILCLLNTTSNYWLEFDRNEVYSALFLERSLLSSENSTWIGSV